MWQHIAVTSLGVIGEAELEFGSGLTVITGETGAGKTMLVTALGLLRGERADLALVRQGSKQARVEASIRVNEDSPVRELVDEVGGVVEGQELLLARVLTEQGRSRAFVGGASVPATVLSQISDHVVAVHGQSDQHRLLRAGQQRRALDEFAGGQFADVATEFGPRWLRLREIDRRIEDLTVHAQERARELDQISFGLEEIAAVDPGPDEDVNLLAEEDRLAHAESLVNAALGAHEVLAGGDVDDRGAQSLLATASAALDQASGHDEELDNLSSRARELAILVDELAAELSAYSTAVDLDPARLHSVQERRAAIGGLLRKYGPTLDDVIAWRDKATERHAELEIDDSSMNRLVQERTVIDNEAREYAMRMTEIRREAADRLAELVSEELTALSMPHARLMIDVTSRATLNAHGLDDIEFTFAANAGAPSRPLHKGASGGELSRLMLALEVVLVDRTSVPTLVFDEVDAGIGGKAAVEVGKRLARLAEHAQVFVVTHLPQVAAFADHHFYVHKDDDGYVTSSSVRELVGEDRVDELARMLAGLDESDAARAHARELLQRAAKTP